MDPILLEKLTHLHSRFEELEVRLSRPETANDPKMLSALLREHAELMPIMEAFFSYRMAKGRFEEAEQLLTLGDSEIVQLAKEERSQCLRDMNNSLLTLQRLLTPSDPDDEKDVVIEIRAAAGGEEAALFASDLYRMYIMYAEKCGLSTSVVSSNETELGGYRTVSFTVEGEGAFARFRYESGVHRVQRVPKTESQGRIQTSTVTVAVLPQAEEVDVTILPSDLTFESMKSSGAGGQHINKTESAVRLTHKPSGIVIECDGERSQFKNRETALKMLRTRLYEMERCARHAEISEKRREQVGTGERCERIRTYNFPQSRVTDHRIGFVSHGLESILCGELELLITALRDRMNEAD